MSFSEAANKVVAYYDRHAKGLCNEQPMEWAITTIEDPTVFDPTSVAADYKDEYNKENDSSSTKLVKKGVQLAWLSGVQRDFRAQFLSCFSSDPKVQTTRNGQEFCRHAFELVKFFMPKLKGIIDNLQKTE